MVSERTEFLTFKDVKTEYNSILKHLKGFSLNNVIQFDCFCCLNMTARACKTKRQLVVIRVDNNAAIILTENVSEILALFYLPVVFTLSFVNSNLIGAYR